MTKCKQCGEPIIWANTPSGSAVRLNERPVDVCHVEKTATGDLLVATMTKGHVLHVLTCAKKGAV